MRKVESLLSEYGESHQNATNKMIHWICVPSILFSLLGLLFTIKLPFLTDLIPALGNYSSVALIVIVFAIIYYFTISVPLTFGMLLIVLPMLYILNFLELTVSTPLWIISVAIFVAAWIGQFYGHKIEGKKPSFFKDVQFLLIGPAWLLHFIYKKIGIPY